MTAEDGVSYLTYQVEVFREVPPATNARLTGLTLSGATIPESFDSRTYEYTATTSLATTTVTPELSDPDATAVIKLGGVTDVDGTVNLALGANVITVEVTAEDRTTRQTYTVTVTRQDTAAPTFVSATVNGTTLVMTFNEELGAAASLANGAFTVKKGSGGTEQTLSGSPSISGSTVTLTLATAVSATDTAVKVAYTKPTTGTANKVVDTFGNEAATFPDQDVGNELADSIPPEPAATDAAVLAADGLDADADLQRGAEGVVRAGGVGVHGEGDARGGQRGGGGAGVQRRRDGERQHGGAEAGGPNSAQRRLGEGALRQAGDWRGDRGRERERRRGRSRTGRCPTTARRRG